MNSSDTKERNTYTLVKHETTNSYIWYKNESMRPYDTKKVQSNETLDTLYRNELTDLSDTQE